MTLRILIADDEELARLKIKDLLSGIPNTAVVAEAGNGEEALSKARQFRPDLMILDIQMPGLDGFQVVERLDPPPLFLFATAYDEHAVRAFEVAAVDYILKPFGKPRLARAIERARKRLGAGRPDVDLADLLSRIRAADKTRIQRFSSRKGGRVVMLEVGEITHFIMEDTILFACRGLEKFPIQGTLDALEGSLDPDRFFRSHRSVIVNVDKIREIRPMWKGSYVIELKVEKSPRLPLSRRQAALLRRRFPW